MIEINYPTPQHVRMGKLKMITICKDDPIRTLRLEFEPQLKIVIKCNIRFGAKSGKIKSEVTPSLNTH